jgi:hypothetical protein
MGRKCAVASVLGRSDTFFVCDPVARAHCAGMGLGRDDIPWGRSPSEEGGSAGRASQPLSGPGQS